MPELLNEGTATADEVVRGCCKDLLHVHVRKDNLIFVCCQRATGAVQRRGEKGPEDNTNLHARDLFPSPRGRCGGLVSIFQSSIIVLCVNAPSSLLYSLYSSRPNQLVQRNTHRTFALATFYLLYNELLAYACVLLVSAFEGRKCRMIAIVYGW